MMAQEYTHETIKKDLELLKVAKDTLMQISTYKQTKKVTGEWLPDCILAIETEIEGFEHLLERVGE